MEAKLKISSLRIAQFNKDGTLRFSSPNSVTPFYKYFVSVDMVGAGESIFERLESHPNKTIDEAQSIVDELSKKYSTAIVRWV